MATSAGKLTPKQELLIAALLTSATIQDAAKAAGVSETTAHRWLRTDADFDAAYRQARRDAVGVAIGRLQQISGAAVAVLANVMANAKTPASSRVTAAVKVIDFAIRAVELEDLQARIAALEERMGDNT